jgi:hypothetical protein
LENFHFIPHTQETSELIYIYYAQTFMVILNLNCLD